MKRYITRLDPGSAALCGGLFGILMGILGMVAWIVWLLLRADGTAVFDEVSPVLVALSPVIAGGTAGFWGLVIGALGAGLFNVVARRTGGFGIELTG